MNDKRLAGLRVLVVEDEALVAMFLEDMLNELGCKVVGLVPRVEAAREFVDEKQIDCAILDVNVNGELIYPFAQVLDDRNVPFLFVTGYNQNSVEPQFQDRPMLQKPFMMTELRALLTGLMPARTGRAKALKPH